MNTGLLLIWVNCSFTYGCMWWYVRWRPPLRSGWWEWGGPGRTLVWWVQSGCRSTAPPAECFRLWESPAPTSDSDPSETTRTRVVSDTERGTSHTEWRSETWWYRQNTRARAQPSCSCEPAFINLIWIHIWTFKQVFQTARSSQRHKWSEQFVSDTLQHVLSFYCENSRAMTWFTVRSPTNHSGGTWTRFCSG